MFRKAMRFPGLMTPVLIIAFLGLLSGCGTGGLADTPAGSTTTTGTTTGATTTDLSALTLSLSSSTVTYGTPVTVTATLRGTSGALVPGAVVTFAATDTLVAFNPSSATALTNAVGVAYIELNAASFASAGAASITASAPTGSDSTVTSAPVGIAVGGAAVTLGALTLGQPSISAYGSSIVSIPVYLASVLTTTPIQVAFTSSCVGSGKATLTSPVTTILGTATSTYKDNNCQSGTDVITASVTGATAASQTITVAIPAVNNIQFVSATPAIIGIKGSGAATLPQSSLVKFKVVDDNNNGNAGVLVDFSLVSAPGGITLSAASATSDVNGEVTTSVNSGTVPTPVWVIAKVHSDPAILSQSNTLTITTGLPTQDFFSLSVQTFNIEGWDIDGVTSTLTIIASDRLGNPIPNGTVINFITEGAQINPASCATTDGTCTVTFKSSAFRPTDGRITILAYAVGEKSFVDGNGNNTYDSGETFYDLGDLYIDANENGSWDAGETYIAYGSGTLPCLTRPSGAALPLGYVSAPSKDNTCDNVWGTNYVRRRSVIVLSGSSALISPTAVTMGSTCIKTFPLDLKDINNNPMPAGTTASTADNYVYYTKFGSLTATKATVNITGGSPVVNTTNFTQIGLTVEADCTAGIPVSYPAGTVNVVITTPVGLITRIPITVNP